MIGVFGDEAQTGKSSSGDLREGKKTYLVEQFYKQASAKEKSLFEEHFAQKDLQSSGASLLKKLLISSKAKESTEAAIAQYAEQARSALEGLASNGIDVSYLEQLIDKTIRRTK